MSLFYCTDEEKLLPNFSLTSDEGLKNSYNMGKYFQILSDKELACRIKSFFFLTNQQQRDKNPNVKWAKYLKRCSSKEDTQAAKNIE